MKGFNLIDCHIDFRIYTRQLTGRLTKYRYKAIDRFCRRNTFRENCGCEYDCCGHFCGQRAEFEVLKNGVVKIEIIQNFNY